MSIKPSERTNRIKPSATMAVNAKASELKSQGIDIINLSVGEPDFPTPNTIKAAGIQAIHENHTHYTAVDGLPEVKQGIINKLKRDNQLNYKMEEIIVTPGAKQALYNAIQAIVNAGDEVIIPAPYWVSYAAMVELADGKSVIVKTGIQQHFKITPEQLEAHITPRTKAFILNSPSNPTGMVYSFEELNALGKVLEKYPNICIISDDIYEYILWGKKQYHNFLNACPDMHNRTILINGVSKAYAMTGWRIGYSAAPAEITKAMKKVQSHSTSSACSISQLASLTALEMDYAELEPMYNQFKQRHDLVVAGLSKIRGVDVLPADGAFYVFPHIEALLKRTGCANDVELATFLLEKAHVATVPGAAFGAPGYLRLSCAASEDALKKAIERIRNCI
jgi:aspartate aminotransferase